MVKIEIFHLKFINFLENLVKTMQKNGIFIKDENFTPHMTLMKLSKMKNYGRLSKLIRI
jgi:hypothetical protein